jgi:glycosyltransferase involved in cell wall biosynthesis
MSAAAGGHHRILHVLPDLAIGGGQTIVLQHVRHADRDRFDVTVCHLSGEDDLAPSFMDAGVTPIHLGLGSRVGATGALGSLVRLARQADLLHVHSDLDRKYGHAAGLAARIPVVGHLHAEWVHFGPMYAPDPSAVDRVRARATGWGRDWLERRAVRHYIAESRDVRDVFTPLVSVPIAVLNQAVAIDRFGPPDPDRTAQLRKDLAPAGAPVLMCVSRLVPGKGQARLLTLLPAILERWPAATLVLVGDGSERAAMEAQVAASGLRGSVRMLGARFDIPDLLAAADLFLFASESEGFGLAVLEAMAARAAVVAFRLPALEEFVTEGTNGYLVDQNDETAFVARVDQLLGDPARRRSMGEAGRALVERHYAPDAVARSFEAVYEHVLNGPALTVGAPKEVMA